MDVKSMKGALRGVSCSNPWLIQCVAASQMFLCRSMNQIPHYFLLKYLFVYYGFANDILTTQPNSILSENNRSLFLSENQRIIQHYFKWELKYITFIEDASVC